MGSRKKHHEKDIEEQLDAEQLAEIEKLMKE